MKKKVMGIMLLSLLLGVVVYSTLALFSDSQAKKGTITTGQVKISLIETDDKGKPYVEETKALAPGDEINRVVSVKNVGNKPAWIRVKFSKSFVEPKSEMSDDNLRFVEVDAQSKWTLSDGYYYYQDSLAAGEETEPFFKKVKLNILADNRFSDQKINVDIEAEGVQTDNNGEAVTEAVGWPN